MLAHVGRLFATARKKKKAWGKKVLKLDEERNKQRPKCLITFPGRLPSQIYHQKNMSVIYFRSDMP